MNFGGISFTLISATFFMGLVAWYSYVKTKGEVSDSSGYFLAGQQCSGNFTYRDQFLITCIRIESCFINI